MKAACKRFWADESATTSVEYALIAVIIGIGLVVTLQNIIELLQGKYAEVEQAF